MEEQSQKINANWPDENRLHFEILYLPPVLVLKVSLQTIQRAYFLAIPRFDAYNKPNLAWRQVGADREYVPDNEKFGFRSWVNLYRVQRGPAGKARILARIGSTGCAGSSGLLYEAWEWDPAQTGDLIEIIKQNGAMGMDRSPDGHGPTPKDPFHPIGILRTGGPLIALPYCWFSNIDTWDNPSLCAVDTYDVSTDDVSFRSHAYNRPDLIPIARVLEAIEKHDYPTIAAYCASDRAARKLLRLAQPFGPSGELDVHHIDSTRERVTFADGERFEMVKLKGRWLIAAFIMN